MSLPRALCSWSSTSYLWDHGEMRGLKVIGGPENTDRGEQDREENQTENGDFC